MRVPNNEAKISLRVPNNDIDYTNALCAVHEAVSFKYSVDSTVIPVQSIIKKRRYSVQQRYSVQMRYSVQIKVYINNLCHSRTQHVLL